MANQIIIDIGAAANDGTGDPLRTAFNYVNNNFSNVWNTGLPNSNVQFSDNRILTVNTNANLVLAPNGIGKVASNVDIVPNTANAFSLGGVTRRWNTVYTQYLDVSNYISGTLGNVTVAVANLHVTGGSNGYVLQTDGAGNLTWTAQTGGGGNGVPGGANTQIQYNNAGSFGGSAAFTFNRTSNVLSVSGNISVGNIGVTNTIYSDECYINNGTFTGETNTGSGSLYVGSPTFTVLGTDIMAQFTGNVTNYAQLNLQNYSNSVTASGDYIITADNGNDSTKFLDMGITSSTWDGSQTNVLDGLSPNNGYLYVQDGNLTLGVRNGSTSYRWNFDTTGNLTVAGNVIPAGNNTQSLGSATRQWSDLYLSNATIYMNNVPLSLTAGNVLTINGADVVTTNANGQSSIGNLDINGTDITIAEGATETQISIAPNIEGPVFLQLPNSGTANVANVRLHNDVGNIELATAAGEWYFGNNGVLTLPNGAKIGPIEFPNGNDFYSTGEDGYSELNWDNTNYTWVDNEGATVSSNGNNWTFGTTGTLTLPNGANITTVDNTITQINSAANSAINLRTFDANGNVGASTFFDGAAGTLDFYSFNYTTDNSYNWRFDNGGSFTLPNAPGNIYFGEDANQPVIIPEGVGITLSANRADVAVDYIAIGQYGIDLATVNNINIDNSSATSLGTDINIKSGDDIFLRGRNKPDDSENEGGDINVYAGQGANAVTGGNDTGNGGDINIYAGAGGIATYSGTGGSNGGYVEILGGDGGNSVDSFVGSGGGIDIIAGSAPAPSDPANGGWGGGISLIAGATTRVNENGGSIELTTGQAAESGTGAAGYVSINIPTSNVGPGGNWYFTGTGRTFQVPADSEIYGANFGNFTVGCAGNTIVTSSDYGANVKNWVFGYTGNLLAPGNIITPTNFVGTSLRTNLSDFNWSADIANMNTGATTVIVLANYIFGEEWTGQVTITNVEGATEANATWWYVSTNENSIQLYTDNTFTTPVDSSAWGAYTGGGSAATLNYDNIEINGQNVIIQSGQADYSNRIWEFTRYGYTIFPTLDVNLHNGGVQQAQTLQFGNPSRQAVITGPTPAPGDNAQRLIIQGQNGGTGEGGDVYLWGGDADTNGGDIKIYAGDADNPASGSGGYVNIDGGYGYSGGGDVSITGGESSVGLGGDVILTGGSAASGGIVEITGGQGGTDNGGNANISGGYGANIGGAVNITGGGAGTGLPGYGNVNISAGASGWTFDNTGTLTFPSLANISGGNLNAGTASASVALNAFSPDGNTVSIQAQGNSSSAVISVFADAGPTTNQWSFESDGTLRIPGNGLVYNSGGYATVKGTDGAELYYTNGVDAGATVGVEDVTTYLLAANTTSGQASNVLVTVNQIDAKSSGNIYLHSGTNIWNFDSAGTLTAPGNISGNVNGYEIGYRNIPQIVFAGDVQVSATDSGKHYYNGTNTDYTVSLVDSGAITYPVGMAVTIVNKGTGNIAVEAFPGVSLYLAGNATAGNRTVGSYGMATVINVDTDVWMINGTGVS